MGLSEHFQSWAHPEVPWFIIMSAPFDAISVDSPLSAEASIHLYQGVHIWLPKLSQALRRCGPDET
jgi:hypothetical protein